MWRSWAALALVVCAGQTAKAETFVVDPEVGNSNFSAVFDAAFGEEINAISSRVGCSLTFDEKSSTVSGSCSVPLTSIVVDADATKTEHFEQWATNKKSPPQSCRLDARFTDVRLHLVPNEPTKFSADVPFTICGRSRTDGGTERIEGTVLLFPAGSYGMAKTIRVRARIEHFSRDRYHIGPQYTDGWLARVQRLAHVVADEGTIHLSLFAKAK